MTKAVQRRRGTASEHQTFTGLEGEITVNTTNDSVHVHDGSTAGGFELARADGSNVDGFSITGNLGIGTSDPKERFEIAGRDSNIRIYGRSGISDNSISSNLYFDSTWTRDDVTSGAVAIELDTRTDNALKFYTTAATSGYPSEAARIDSSGNLLVGHSGSIFNNINTTSTLGSSYSSNGEIFACSDQSSGVMFLNRKTTDGAIATFRKDGSTVGSIGTSLGYTKITSGDGANGSGLLFGNSQIYPVEADGVVTDDAVTFGDTSNRFKDLYLSGGVYLGGTGSANLLDDYESGSFELTTASDATGSLDGDSYGYYVKVGEMVTVQIVFLVTANFSSNRIGNLPFTPTNADTGISTIHGGGVLFYSTYIGAARISNNSSSISFYDTSGNAINPSTSDDPFRFTLTYRTS